MLNARRLSCPPLSRPAWMRRDIGTAASAPIREGHASGLADTVISHIAALRSRITNGYYVRMLIACGQVVMYSAVVLRQRRSLERRGKPMCPLLTALAAPGSDAHF
jgi:hypothetical protein